MAKILLVGDDDYMRRFMGRALERAGYEVFSVARMMKPFRYWQKGALICCWRIS